VNISHLFNRSIAASYNRRYNATYAPGLLHADGQVRGRGGVSFYLTISPADVAVNGLLALPGQRSPEAERGPELLLL